MASSLFPLVACSCNSIDGSWGRCGGELLFNFFGESTYGRLAISQLAYLGGTFALNASTSFLQAVRDKVCLLF